MANLTKEQRIEKQKKEAIQLQKEFKKNIAIEFLKNIVWAIRLNFDYTLAMSDDDIELYIMDSPNKEFDINNAIKMSIKHSKTNIALDIMKPYMKDIEELLKKEEIAKKALSKLTDEERKILGI